MVLTQGTLKIRIHVYTWIRIWFIKYLIEYKFETKMISFLTKGVFSPVWFLASSEVSNPETTEMLGQIFLQELIFRKCNHVLKFIRSHPYGNLKHRCCLEFWWWWFWISTHQMDQTNHFKYYAISFVLPCSLQLSLMANDFESCQTYSIISGLSQTVSIVGPGFK